MNMESIVADTNAVASAILRKGLSQKILLLGACRFYAPDFLKEELIEHEEEFIAKSGLPKEKYLLIVQIILENVVCLPAEEYMSFKKEAMDTSPDKDDWPFFAVALYLNCPIWSNDKLLNNQERVIIYNTSELGRLFFPDEL